MRPFPKIPGQRGLATTAQLLESGWTESAIRHLALRDGQRVYPTVWLPHRGPVDQPTRLVAGALWAGEGATLTGGHALLLHGLPLGWTPRIAHYLVPKTRNRRDVPAARTVRSDRACPTRTLRGIPVAGLDRALTDAGLLEEIDAMNLKAAALTALQSRLTSPARLTAELADGRRNGSAPIRRALAEYADGLWSAAEARLGRVLARRPALEVLHNPRIETPGRLLIGVPDAYLPRLGVAVQVHSRRFHSGVDATGQDAWESTVEADSEFVAAGIAVLGVAPTTLRDHPERFLARLDATTGHRAGFWTNLRIVPYEEWNPGVGAAG